MVQFASYLRRVLCKTRLICPRINGPILGSRECVPFGMRGIAAGTMTKSPAICGRHLPVEGFQVSAEVTCASAVVGDF